MPHSNGLIIYLSTITIIANINSSNKEEVIKFNGIKGSIVPQIKLQGIPQEKNNPRKMMDCNIHTIQRKNMIFNFESPFLTIGWYFLFRFR